MQTGLTGTEKIGKLLDVIPTRGPDAFDRFCEALLACDHAHVAEYLKTLEGTVTSHESYRATAAIPKYVYVHVR